MGEITSSAKVDVEKIARETIKKIGYDKDEYGFNYETVEIKMLLNKQSPDIALGVDESVEHREGGDDYDRIGAGDQGLMFGYATDMRSKTQGRGQYTMEPDNYAEVPKSVSEAIISARNKKAE